MKRFSKRVIWWAAAVAIVATLFAPALVSYADDVPVEYPTPGWGECYNALTH
ncbi:MAG: hypothetical protein AMXMBFR84_22330 [Candidatus Hydrogenedentota bacterium]